jgi:hypothetical protein
MPVLTGCGQSTAEVLENDGADERSRTADLLITNQLLYQLSYVGLGIEPDPHHSNDKWLHRQMSARAWHYCRTPKL